MLSLVFFLYNVQLSDPNFKFFRMGEWVDIVVDDRLPTRKRAAPSDTDEWWVPLVEKAYAKFNGSYDKIIGGNTCWAMTDLTGGISGFGPYV